VDCVQRYITGWIFGGQSPTLSFERAEKISLLLEAPLRPEARGICHICHMVNPALVIWMNFPVVCCFKNFMLPITACNSFTAAK